MKKWFYFLLVSFGLTSQLCQGQAKALILPSISISAPYKLKESTFVNQILDSSQFASAQQGLIGMLAFKPSVYIKNYGPGSISSIAMRGTAAAHTAIIWKGIPINNAMLGICDLSQLSGMVLQNARIQEGGCGQMAVTENFGGILILGDNNLTSNVKDHFTLNFRIGSFHTNQNQFYSQFKFKKARIGLKFWNLTATNDFSFELEGLRQRQKHANRSNRGVEAEVSVPFSENIQFETALWVQENESEIPAAMFQSHSKARQRDQNFRLSSKLNWLLGKTQLQAGQGFTRDVINYVDPSSRIDSRNKVNNHFVWVDAKQTKDNWSFSGNIWASNANVETNNYSFTPVARRLAFTGNSSYQFPRQPFQINFQLRVENFRFSNIEKSGAVALPSFSMDWDLKSLGKLKAGLHRKMRLPTLNDLYWNPGGNSNLKPETGWTSDVCWNLNAKISKDFSLESDWQVYHSQINNYIQWLPRGYLWQPENVAQVKILGAGLSEKLTFSNGGNLVFVSVNFHLSHSVNTKKRFEGDESINKQLIYIPLWQNQLVLGWRNGKVEAQIWCQQTDKRYIDPSNSLYLNAFHTMNARLSYKFILEKNCSINLFGEGLNLTSVKYQSVAGFTMPLQQFSTGIQIQFF